MSPILDTRHSHESGYATAQIDLASPAGRRGTPRREFDARGILMEVSTHFPPRVEPMAAALAREPFHRPGWIHEEKYDGWRMLAFKDGGFVRLISRKGVDHTTRFRDVVSMAMRLC